MKNYKYSVLLIATLLICQLYFFLPCAVNAQELKFNNSVNIRMAFTKSDYHVIVKNVDGDSAYTNKNIFVNINDIEKNLIELTPVELRQTIVFILKCWDEESKRELERQRKLYDIINAKNKGKK